MSQGRGRGELRPLFFSLSGQMNSTRYPAATLLGLVLAEAAVWHGIGASFLVAYAGLHSVGQAAVLAHLSLVTIVWGYVVCIRIGVWRLVPSHHGARAVNALTVTLALATLLAYYAAVLVGLHSWGRVVTWRLIETYSRDSVDLLHTLGVSPIAAFVGLALTMLGAAFGLARATVRIGWARDLSRRLSSPVALICVLAGASILTVRVLVFAGQPLARDGEPVSLTFFPEQASHARQSHSWGNTPAREAAESGARKSYVPSVDADRRNVIVIIGDALRPDHMSVYGYHRTTTPQIDALARGGHLTRADRMVAVCAESSCGLLGISRSKYVHEFTDRDFSFQEVLRRHGYRIHFILSGDHTNFYGLREAYGQVDSYFDGASAQGRYMNDDELVFDRLSSLPAWGGEPVMMQFHLMSTHGLGTRQRSSERFHPATNYYKAGAVRASGSPEPAAEAVNFYDSGVLQFDSEVGRILESLKSKGYLESAIVVITADHGELLGEHGLFGHGSTVHEQVLRVPFLLFDFGGAAARPLAQAELSSQLDIAPTLLARLRMRIPSTWSGRPLQQAPNRSFVRFQQGARVGLFDLRSPGRIWKYFLDIATGEEFAVDATDSVDESRNRIAEVPADLRNEWKRQVMEAGSAVVVRNECCVAQARLN